MPIFFRLPRAKKSDGFSLVELLVVVSIVTVLSVTGLAVFQTVRTRAQEAKYKADVNAIKKAYEKNFDPSLNNGQGGYKPLQTTDFVDGKIPADKNGNSYIVTSQTNGVITSFAACVNPKTGDKCTAPSSAESSPCSCAASTQGAGGQVSSFSVPSCDPYGILGTGLYGYWRMEEASGNREDSSGFGNTLTPGTGGVGSGVGVSGNTATFVSVNSQYLSIQPNSNLQPANTSFTITAWVKFNNNNARYAIINEDGLSNGAPGAIGDRKYVLMYESQGSGRFTFRVFDDTTADQPTATSNSFGSATAGVWYFVVGRYDMANNMEDITIGHAGSLYTDSMSTIVNGNAVVIPSAPTPPVTPAPILIGKPSFGSYTDGSIDDVRFYKRFLSDAEIAALYNQGAGCFSQ